MSLPFHNGPAGVVVDGPEFRVEPAAPRASCVTELSLTEPKRGPRVLHLVDTLNVGGTEKQLAQVALRMHAAGSDVVVGCLRAEGPLLQVLREAGIPVVEFRKEKTLFSLNGVRQLLRLAGYLRK